MSRNKRSPILEAIYETACDLHSCGAFTDEQMQKYEELAPQPKPVKIDYDVFDYLNKKCDSNSEKLRVLISDSLRKEFQIPRAVS
ncbi:MAG: hypothetical protein QX194_04410 [Methylococcales bacterium]